MIHNLIIQKWFRWFLIVLLAISLFVFVYFLFGEDCSNCIKDTIYFRRQLESFPVMFSGCLIFYYLVFITQLSIDLKRKEQLSDRGNNKDVKKSKSFWGLIEGLVILSFLGSMIMFTVGLFITVIEELFGK